MREFLEMSSKFAVKFIMEVTDGQQIAPVDQLVSPGWGRRELSGARLPNQIDAYTGIAFGKPRARETFEPRQACESALQSARRPVP
jgi:hypothetical protein